MRIRPGYSNQCGQSRPSPKPHSNDKLLPGAFSPILMSMMIYISQHGVKYAGVGYWAKMLQGLKTMYDKKIHCVESNGACDGE